MDRIKMILAPTDLSELSKVGVRYALEFAESQGAEVIAYHVADYRVPYSKGEFASLYISSLSNYTTFKEEFDKFLREAFPSLISKVKLHQEVDVGVAHGRIVEKAAKEGVDMIVMSTHGSTGLLHMLIGSVTEQVVRHATCPVLSVSPTKEDKLAQTAAG